MADGATNAGVMALLILVQIFWWVTVASRAPSLAEASESEAIFEAPDRMGALYANSPALASATGSSTRKSGIQIGANNPNSQRGAGARGSSTIKIGPQNTSSLRNISAIAGGTSRHIYNVSRTSTTTTSTTPSTTTIWTTTIRPMLEEDIDAGTNSSNEPERRKLLTVGLVVPYKSFGKRDYTRAVTNAISAVQRATVRSPTPILSREYELQGHLSMVVLTPSPKGKIGTFLL